MISRWLSFKIQIDEGRYIRCAGSCVCKKTSVQRLEIRPAIPLFENRCRTGTDLPIGACPSPPITLTPTFSLSYLLDDLLCSMCDPDEAERTKQEQLRMTMLKRRSKVIEIIIKQQFFLLSIKKNS